MSHPSFRRTPDRSPGQAPESNPLHEFRTRAPHWIPASAGMTNLPSCDNGCLLSPSLDTGIRRYDELFLLPEGVEKSFMDTEVRGPPAE